MHKTSVVTSFRYLHRHPMYTGLLIFGLALGLATSFALAMVIQYELSFDRFHQKADRIYRLIFDTMSGKTRLILDQTPAVLAPTLMEEFPQVVHATHIFQGYVLKVGYNDQRFDVMGHFADTEFFEVFTFPLISGGPISEFDKPGVALITESLAKRIFGDQEPIGKTLTSISYVGQVQIIGVLKDAPPNAHFTFDILVSFPSLLPTRLAMGWGAFQFKTYVLLAPRVNPSVMEERLQPFALKHYGQDRVKDWKLHLRLQPLTDIYFGDIPAPVKGDIRRVYLFSAIALVILFMSCANYINLASAQLIGRAREAGIRKILGGSRIHLFAQFTGEALLVTIVALPISLLILEGAQPFLALLTRQAFQLNWQDHFDLIWIILATTLVVAIGSGVYPALLIASVTPLTVLQKRAHKHITVAHIQRGLVIFQFVIAISLITSVLFIRQQVDYVRTAGLGFDKDQVVFFSMPEPKFRKAIKQALLKSPSISHVTGSSGAPGVFSGIRVSMAPEGADEDKGPRVLIVYIDEDFIPALSIQIKEGRNFSTQHASVDENAFILNEAALRALGWQSGVDKTVKWRFGPMKVIGVVKDFHNQSLHNPIEPMAFRLNPFNLSMLVAHLNPEKPEIGLAHIRKTWQTFHPDLPLELSFLDERLDRLYKDDENFQLILTVFTILALAIACLGLFGLSACVIGQRTKESGIRRILGASLFQIIAVLSKEFTLLVLIASTLACPITYYFVSRWLENFTYRTEITVLPFFIGASATLLLTLLSIGYHAVKAAQANPADTLRYE